MYESPINLIITDIYNQIQAQQEEGIYKAVLHYVPDINKDELIRALRHDREQYEKGYADGERDAMDSLVRCKDCRWSRINQKDDADVYYCELRTGRAYHSGDFCSYGERKGGEG